MSDINPYESPQAEAGSINPLSERVLTDNMLYYLRGASPWLRFIGIVGFIGIGLVALFILVLAFGMGGALSEIDGFSGMGFMGPLLSLIYLPTLVLYFFPVLFLYRFGSKIKNYLFSGNAEDLEDAFKNNKSLWTFYGVLTIIALAFVALLLFFGIIAGIMAAVGAFG